MSPSSEGTKPGSGSVAGDFQILECARVAREQPLSFPKLPEVEELRKRGENGE